MNFVTLFDKNYYSRGIALYRSLKKVSGETNTLYILAMDDETYHFLKEQQHKDVVVISTSDVIDLYPELEQIREERTHAEFCWTLTPYSIQYALDSYNLESCTYIDSDLYFYNNPSLLLEEIGDRSVLITEHRYLPQYDRSLTSGKFCVQFMFFRNDTNGREVLEWWRARCEEWCYNRFEDNKFGDQKYLDDWESRFELSVDNCSNFGAGVAPWNSGKYIIEREGDSLYVRDRISRIKQPLIFFHFHGLFKQSCDRWIMSEYEIGKDVKKLYAEYINELVDIESEVPATFISKAYNSPPYKIRHRIWEGLKIGIKTFLKIGFFKPVYMDNIYNVSKER